MNECIKEIWGTKKNEDEDEGRTRGMNELGQTKLLKQWKGKRLNTRLREWPERNDAGRGCGKVEERQEQKEIINTDWKMCDKPTKEKDGE